MKKIENVNCLDLEAAAIHYNFKLIDSINPELCDSFLYIKKEKTKTILLAGFETFKNKWESSLNIYVAKTENDRKKLLQMWKERKNN